jgi:hypothetical protein
MSQEMPSHSERATPDDVFGKLEATLAQWRAAAAVPPAPPESWIKRMFNPAPASSRENEFNIALVGALTQTVSALREITANQESRLEKVALDAFRERSDHLQAELHSAATGARALQQRVAALEAELAQFRQEHAERIQQVLDEQSVRIQQVLDEQSVRIQQVLDEQHVCIRQLSLQASEEAVLTDRARRATELKLEELARRVPPPPA